jgi:hypothetical protein
MRNLDIQVLLNSFQFIPDVRKNINKIKQTKIKQYVDLPKSKYGRILSISLTLQTM